MRQYLFTKQKTIELVEREISPGPEQVGGKTLVSLISAGTEINGPYWNTQGWEYPLGCGYSAVFQIDYVGENTQGLKKGDLAFCCGNHADYQLHDGKEVIKLPEGMEPETAAVCPNGRDFYGNPQPYPHPSWRQSPGSRSRGSGIARPAGLCGLRLSSDGGGSLFRAGRFCKTAYRTYHLWAAAGGRKRPERSCIGMFRHTTGNDDLLPRPATGRRNVLGGSALETYGRHPKLPIAEPYFLSVSYCIFWLGNEPSFLSRAFCPRLSERKLFLSVELAKRRTLTH